MATHDIIFRGFLESVCKSDGEPSIVARKYEVAWRRGRVQLEESRVGESQGNAAIGTFQCDASPGSRCVWRSLRSLPGFALFLYTFIVMFLCFFTSTVYGICMFSGWIRFSAR